MLRISEHLALSLVCANMLAFLWVSTDSSAAAQLNLPLLTGFAVFFMLLLVLVGQVTPLAEARAPKLSQIAEPEGLSQSDFKAVMAFAPRYQKLIALCGLSALGVAFALFGEVSWSTGTPFTERHARGISLSLAALSALLYPVLGAFARLPPSLAERMALLRRDDA